MKAPSTPGQQGHGRHGGHHRLKFHWPQRSPVSLALVGFLFLSVLAHGLAFYILQVVDPPAVVIAPPPVQVNLLTGTSAENRAVLEWIDANDPAAIASTHEIVPGGINELQYQRALADVQTEPKAPEEIQPPAAFPPAVDTMAVLGASQGPAAPPAAAMVPPPTVLRFSGELAGRRIVKPPALKFDGAALDRAPDSFMVGVDSDGKVLYTFFMGLELDDLVRHAEDCLAAVEFSRLPNASNAPSSVTWGMATYYWGDDSDRTGAGASAGASTGTTTQSQQSQP